MIQITVTCYELLTTDRRGLFLQLNCYRPSLLPSVHCRMRRFNMNLLIYQLIIFPNIYKKRGNVISYRSTLIKSKQLSHDCNITIKKQNIKNKVQSGAAIMSTGHCETKKTPLYVSNFAKCCVTFEKKSVSFSYSAENFVKKSSIYIPLQLKCIFTLPCEIISTGLNRSFFGATLYARIKHNKCAGHRTNGKKNTPSASAALAGCTRPVLAHAVI